LPLPKSPLLGSNSPRPIAPNRSFIAPRSTLVALPLSAIVSVGASLENPGGSSDAIRAVSSVDAASLASVALSPCACTCTCWR